MQRISFRLKLILLTLSLLSLVAGGVALDYRAFLNTPLSASADRTIIIEPGMSAEEVVALLERDNVVKDSSYLSFYLWWSGAAARLQPGSYHIEEALTPVALIEALTKGGQRETITLVVEPGMTLFALAERVHSQGLADRKAFLSRTLDPQLAAELGLPARSLEGYLLAGTYELKRDAGLDALITSLHQRFRETWLGLAQPRLELMERLRAQGYGDHELITIASMVEREVVHGDEAPVVARVFFNRLGRGMKLQSDPTCIYPPQSKDEKPSPKRCKDKENTYSTYIIPALPPGPIGAPTKASLAAVLEPYAGPKAETLLFFVARADGSWRHYFSATYDEHKEAIEHFIRKGGPMPTRTPQPRTPSLPRR